METTLKERLITIATRHGMSTRKFEKTLGVANGWIGHIGKNISADKMSKIVENFPEVNPMWLQYGKGDMILSTGDANSQNVANAPHNSGTINQQAGGDVSVYQKLINLMEEKIEMMKAEKDAFLVKHGCASFEEMEQKLEEMKK